MRKCVWYSDSGASDKVTTTTYHIMDTTTFKAVRFLDNMAKDSAWMGGLHGRLR